MKNFKDIRNNLNEFLDRSQGMPGGGDDEHSMRNRLLIAMHRIPFEYKTSDGHELKFNSSTDALLHIGRQLADHDHAFVQHYRGYDTKSPMVQYHSDAADKMAEVYEALRDHIQNHEGISPHFRSYTNSLFNFNRDHADTIAARDGRRIEQFSAGHAQHQEPFTETQEHLQKPDKGYFVHKKEME